LWNFYKTVSPFLNAKKYLAKGQDFALDIIQKAQEAKAAEERAKLDAYFRGFEASGGDSSNRYDGADSFEQYSAEPTAYSGSS